ncbi:MAG: hypothetical protein KUG79_06810 [Pseudomonadales bacterium]|nr:hypothetical protein [Pseudomonadales bacterium]
MPTLILGSALDILEFARPPRAQFLNFPLGFETGPPNDRLKQIEIVGEALKGFETFTAPLVNSLPFSWQAGWQMIETREREEKRDDQRSIRSNQPQYQTDKDRQLAEGN